MCILLLVSWLIGWLSAFFMEFALSGCISSSVVLLNKVDSVCWLVQLFVAFVVASLARCFSFSTYSVHGFLNASFPHPDGYLRLALRENTTSVSQESRHTVVFTDLLLYVAVGVN